MQLYEQALISPAALTHWEPPTLLQSGAWAQQPPSLQQTNTALVVLHQKNLRSLAAAFFCRSVRGSASKPPETFVFDKSTLRTAPMVAVSTSSW